MRAIIALLFALLALPAAADAPKLIGRVNDHAAVMTVEQRAALEQKLEAIEKTEGNPQVAVLLPVDMGGADIERFTNDTFKAWKLGQAGKDNGVLIVIAPKERKWRIEVGYGLEGRIPDGRAKAILANDMDPHLKGGKVGFYAALDAAATSIAADIAKEQPAAKEPQSFPWIILIIFVIAGGATGLFVLLTNYSNQRRREEEQRTLRQRTAAATMRQPAPSASSSNPYAGRHVAAAAASAGLGGGIGAAAATAALARPRREQERPRTTRRDDDTPSRSSSYSSSSDSGSSYSSSSSSDSGSSSSFSSGGGDSGGGGASSGD